MRLAIGYRAIAAHPRATDLGSGTTATAPDQVAVGPRDVEVQHPTRGLILRSPDGSRWRVTITNAGTLTTTRL